MSDDRDEEKKVLPKPVDWDELYPNRFIKAGELKGEKVTLRISDVLIEELIGDKGAKIKGVISFERTDKQWALNKTNGFCLREMFGRKVQEWVGKRVTLFASKIESGKFRGEDCIRVWGSPDIAGDMQVSIVMPRKRPVPMTMHKTLPKGAAAPTQASTAAAAPTMSDAVAKVRGAATLDALAEARKGIWGLYAAANTDVPLDVEMAASDRRRELEGK